MIQTASGVTRRVFLIAEHAIKVPRVRYGWDKFLRGLLSNIQEQRFSCMSAQFSLCPTRWSMWGGWLNIQQRCKPLTDEEWATIEHFSDWNGFSCDFKRENFGTLNGRIVLLDYGELT